MQVQVNLNIPSAAAAPRGSRTQSKYVTKVAKAARRHSRPHGSVGAVARTAAAASSTGAAHVTTEVTNWAQTPMPPGHVHAMLQDQDWAIDDPLASRDDFFDALRIQGHPDQEHDPTIGLFDILSDLLGRAPDRLVWTREAVEEILCRSRLVVDVGATPIAQRRDAHHERGVHSRERRAVNLRRRRRRRG